MRLLAELSFKSLKLSHSFLQLCQTEDLEEVHKYIDEDSELSVYRSAIIGISKVAEDPFKAQASGNQYEESTNETEKLRLQASRFFTEIEKLLNPAIGLENDSNKHLNQQDASRAHGSLWSSCSASSLRSDRQEQGPANRMVAAQIPSRSTRPSSLLVRPNLRRSSVELVINDRLQEAPDNAGLTGTYSSQGLLELPQTTVESEMVYILQAAPDNTGLAGTNIPHGQEGCGEYY